ncbi:AAA family ATPase (plasmid) [Arcobacter cryaerophilus gv. pseudocryaerophilus]|uniref:AAA family ATPase n=3 Tax=Arcobacteraceae TaxID=2808963 RepID=A0AA96DWW8_9BACT|nr:AAA family ATPase [Arcobacter sp. AZ-2023]WNL37299.1 AAA family ATPase [Arcobacter sp. AZ-2023]WPD13015.1 AAA family ATPase [Arcobacter sp. DSM 115960]
MAIKHLTGRITKPSGDFCNIKLNIKKLEKATDTTYSGDMSNTFNNRDTKQQRINLGAMGIKRKTEPNSIKCGESFVLFYYEPEGKYNHKLLKQIFGSGFNQNDVKALEKIFGDRKIVVGVGIIQNYIESFETSSRNDEIIELKAQEEANKKQNQKSYIHCYNNIDKDNKITIFRFPFEKLFNNKELIKNIADSLEVEEEDLGKFKGRSFPVNIFLIEKYITKMIESIQKIKLENLDISNDNKFSNYTDLLNWKTKIRTDFENMKDAGKLVLEEHLKISDLDELEENENESKNKLLKYYLRHYNFDSNDFELIPLDIKKELINELFKQKKEIKNIYSFEDFDDKVKVENNELKTFYRAGDERNKVVSEFDRIFPIINDKFKDKFKIDFNLYKRGTYNGSETKNIVINDSAEINSQYLNIKYKKMMDNPYSILSDYFINTGSSRFLEAFINLDYGEKARLRNQEPGFQKNNINRLISIIISILIEEAEKGDIWVDSTKIKYKLIEKLILLDGNIEEFDEIEELFENNINDIENNIEVETKENINYWCLKILVERENLINNSINDLITNQNEDNQRKLESILNKLDQQCIYYQSKVALQKMHYLNFVFISGVAGSGKSYTLCEYLNDICKDSDNIPNFLVVTPTGKAAHVLKNEIQSSNSNFECIKTYLEDNQNKITHIHNYLRSYYNPKTSFFDIPDNNIPKEIDILVIDEISMVDLILITNLLKVVKPKKLIILGDIKQLPPINGYGNIARTLEKYLSNNTHNSIYLANMTKSHRATNARYIDLSLKLRDEKNEITLEKKNTNEWTFKIKDTVEKTESSINLKNDKTLTISTFQDETSLIGEIKKIYKEIFAQLNFKNNLLLSAENQNLDKIQILTLRNNDGYTSSKSINKELKDKTNGIYPLKYMRLKNIVKDNEFYTNGMIGSLTIDNKLYQMEYAGEKLEQKLTEDSLSSEFSPAYAFTVHKSQGSGFNNVILVLPKNAKGLTRELLYTALTRPKKDGVNEGKLYILLEEGFELPQNLKFDKNRNMSVFGGQDDWCSDGETLSGIFNFNDKTFNRKPDLYIEMLVNFYCTAKSLNYERNYGVYEIKEKEELINLISSFSIINKRDALKILPNYNQDRSNENKVDFMEEDEEDSIITHNGLRTRSWSEAILMLIFDNLKIPYFYEVEIRREDDKNTYKLTYSNLEKEPKIYRIPDFTIVSKYIENFQEEKQAGSVKINDVKCIIEHLGMLENEEYRDGWQKKVKDYYNKYEFDLVAPLDLLYKVDDNSDNYKIYGVWKNKDVGLEEDYKVCKKEVLKLTGDNIRNMKICFTTDENDIQTLRVLTIKLELLQELYKLKKQEE